MFTLSSRSRLLGVAVAMVSFVGKYKNFYISETVWARAKVCESFVSKISKYVYQFIERPLHHPNCPKAPYKVEIDNKW